MAGGPFKYARGAHGGGESGVYIHVSVLYAARLPCISLSLSLSIHPPIHPVPCHPVEKPLKGVDDVGQVYFIKRIIFPEKATYPTLKQPDLFKPCVLEHWNTHFVSYNN